MNLVTKVLLKHRSPHAGAVAFVLAILAVALLPVAAEAKPVKSRVSATVVGVIDSRATVRYFFSGEVSAANFTFGCMEDRRVVLFQVGPKGKPLQVASVKTKLFGNFLGAIEKPLSTISGYYFVKVEPRVRKTRRGRLRCLAARSPTFLVEVPSELID